MLCVTNLTPRSARVLSMNAIMSCAVLTARPGEVISTWISSVSWSRSLFTFVMNTSRSRFTICAWMAM